MSSRKTIYERIASKEEEIKVAQQKVVELTTQLQSLHKDREVIEMKKLFDAMKQKGISLDEAIKKLKK